MISWSEKSRSDIAALLDRYDEIDHDLALRIEQAIIDAPTSLEAFPRAGPAVSRNVRKWIVPGLPIILLYRVDGKQVEVIGVRHMRQNWRRT